MKELKDFTEELGGVFMFWDRVAGIYDLFAELYNGKVHKELCRRVKAMISPDEEVLECACGTGMLSVHIAPRCKSLTATDVSLKMLKKAEKKCLAYPNARFLQADILRLPCPDAQFDTVIAANVIHLLEDPHAALRELSRVCKRGGKLIIPTYINEKGGQTTPIAKIAEKAGANFKRQFTYDSYRQFFSDAGYPKAEYLLIRGRVSCAVALIETTTN